MSGEVPDPELRFVRGVALAELELEAAARLGRYFDLYGEALASPGTALPSGLGGDASSRNKLIGHFGRIRSLTLNQKAMLGWVFQNQAALVTSACEAIESYYSSSDPGDQDPGDDAVRIPPAPDLPPGYGLADFIRITDLFINPEVPDFGMAVGVAWFDEGHLGLRFSECRLQAIGDATVAIV